VVVDYNKDPYTALREALGPNAIENSDACDDKATRILHPSKIPFLTEMYFFIHFTSTMATLTGIDVVEITVGKDANPQFKMVHLHGCMVLKE
jgi:hypothetical protein